MRTLLVGLTNNLDFNPIIHQTNSIIKGLDEKSQEISEKEIIAMEDQFAFDDTRPVEQVFDEYSPDSPEMQNFLDEVKDAYDFTEESTIRYKHFGLEGDENNGNMVTLSLFETPEEYVHTFAVLQLASSQLALPEENKEFHSEYLSNYEEYKNLNPIAEESPLALALINEKDQLQQVTVGDVAKAITAVETIKTAYDIEKGDNYIDELFALKSGDKVIEGKELQTLATEQIEAPQIVESNDGYVMNTDKPITTENAKVLSDKHNVENGNEVKQAVPKETTNDIADVRPNVKLEQARDVGTKEIAEINSGNGTDKDIEALARSSPSYESQTDQGTNKPNKSKDNGLDR